jgi:ParB/RepB/Spo0J family partition protein
MTTFATIPLDKITLHPDNVRRDAAADEEMVESIKAQGILQALSVVEDGDRYLLIAGHRRLDGARQAGLTAVPASILEHLTTRGQQIEAMLVENGQRVDLTPMEEAKAYEQLTLEGYKPKDIAKATGRAVGTVQARLKLNTLGDDAQAKIHARELSLDDAIKLTQLEDYPDLLDEVTATVGSNNFDFAMRQAFAKIDRRKADARLRAEYTERGLPKIEKPEDGWNNTTGPVPASWRPTLEPDAWTELASGPSLVVSMIAATAPKETVAEREHRQSDWEKNSPEREAAKQAALAAAQLRLDQVGAMTAGVKLPAHLDALISLALPGLLDEVGRAQDFFVDIAGLPIPDGKTRYTADWQALGTAHIESCKPAARVRLLFQALAYFTDVDIDETDWMSTTDEVDTRLAYLGLLAEHGHTFNDTDKTIRAALQARRIELEAEEDAA